MRIAYFADGNCHHGAKWINHFAERHEVFLFCLEGQHSFPLLSGKVRAYPVLPRGYPLRNVFERRRTLSRVRRLISEHSIDVVHSMYAVPYAFWASQLGVRNHIATTRGSDVLVDYLQRFRPAGGLRERSKNALLRGLFERSLASARLVTSTSSVQQAVLRRFIKDATRLRLVRTGVDVAAFDAVYGGLIRATPPGETCILCPRMIRPLYNTATVVAGFALVHRTLRGAARLRLIDYGSDPAYLAELRRQVVTQGLTDAVEVVAESAGARFLQLYRDADVVVMTPNSDGTPVTGIETMLARRPLVVGTASYDADLFSDENVVRLRELSPQALADAIMTVVSESPATRQERIERARRSAEAWADLRKSVLEIEALYNGRSTPVDSRTCTRCVMRTEDDPSIEFDEGGVCSFCRQYDRGRSTRLFEGADAKRRLDGLVKEIRRAGRRLRYDCVVGVSGGVDSSYACYTASTLGLRPLVVHLDNSWNTELAVQNIERLVGELGLDLHTHVVDWAEFRDLQLAFFHASVIDIEMLTDHAISALLIKTASRIGVKYVLTGENYATEAILPKHWHHLKSDWLNIRDIHRRFGKVPLRTYPHLGYFERLYQTRLRGIRQVPILDYVEYDKDHAKALITDKLGWRDHGAKHHESFFTRFYQEYILPTKFGVDKRRAHLSSLICSGQMSRQEALQELSNTVPPDRLANDRDYVLKKLGLTDAEFDSYLSQPPHPHTDYASLTRHLRYEEKLMDATRPLRRWLRRVVGGRAGPES